MLVTSNLSPATAISSNCGAINSESTLRVDSSEFSTIPRQAVDAKRVTSRVTKRGGKIALKIVEKRRRKSTRERMVSD
jgi:hypothetical protein